MLRFGETKVTKERFYAAIKPVKIWDVNAGNVVISKLIEAKTNSEYLIGCLDRVIRPLFIIMPKISGYFKAFKVNDNKKLISLRIVDEKLPEKD